MELLDILQHYYLSFSKKLIQLSDATGQIKPTTSPKIKPINYQWETDSFSPIPELIIPQSSYL